MKNAVSSLIARARDWRGYLEKKNNSQLNDFTANAGSGNYTCFARDYREHTGQNFQAQPWCAIFVSEIFVQVFGLEVAKELLGGALYHYCPTGVNQFKNSGRWSTKPEPGAVIFFTNGSRAYHTGIVVEVTATRIKTVEGNTSGGSGVVENGGGVFEKSYARTYERILGYGLPDWGLVDAEDSTVPSQPDQEPAEKPGWKSVPTGIRWRYRCEDGSWAANEWQLINHHWYLFDSDGYMCTGWHRWNSETKQTDPENGSGDWYFLDNTPGGPLEGACWHSRDNGAMEIWEVE